MRAYVVSRLAQTALVVFLSLTAVFVMVRLAGDPVLLFMPMDIQAKDVNEFRQRLGFNDPCRCSTRASSAAHCAATSASRSATAATRWASCSSDCRRRCSWPARRCCSPSSSRCRSASCSAVRRDSVLDHVGTISTVLGQATPGFWLGLDADLPVLGAAPLAADRRHGRRRASRHAVDRAGRVLLGAHRAPHALGGARGARRGVRPDGARQGARRGPRDRQAHACATRRSRS